VNTTLELSELDSKIGQLFMAGIPGYDLDKETEALIRDYNLGGVIFFNRNIQDPMQLAGLCRRLQEKSVEYQNLPLLLAVDQEGGKVARLKAPFTLFAGNKAIGRDKQAVQKAEEFGTVTAREMKMVGLNMNLAPVVDVQRGELEKHLESRSFGEDPEKVGLLGKTVVKALQDNGVMAVAKHFPGLGRATLDPHLQCPKIEVDGHEIEQVNLPPFKAAIEAGVSGIMTSHAIYPALDPQHPATLSPLVLTGLLREILGFEGLIITDDLEMGAIANHRPVAEGAAEAFEAGADILLICKEQENVLKSIHLIRSKVLQGKIPFKRLSQSVKRIDNVRSSLHARLEKISFARIKEYFG
jgi:beta-N-acetylhexosaminidase